MMLETDLKSAPMETKESICKVLTRIRAIVDVNLKEYSSDIFERATSTTPSNVIIAKQPLSTIGSAIRTIIEEEQENATRRGVIITCDHSQKNYQTFAPISFLESCQIFSVLIANAVDAADDGAKKVYITAHRNDSYCEVSIRDFGNGFDVETLENIKAGQRSSTKPNGSDLGLQTVKILIERAIYEEFDSLTNQ